jgi:uncharacterized spore protein YtfJ
MKPARPEDLLPWRGEPALARIDLEGSREERLMTITDVFNKANDSITVKRVFAEPIERDGLTVIPAAVVAGGAGGGTGQDENGQEGQGGGFGMNARPAGAYVIKNGTVSWRPAVDPNRLVAVAGLVAVVFLITRRSRRAERASAKHLTPAP